jgi:hypothetical protein
LFCVASFGENSFEGVQSRSILLNGNSVLFEQLFRLLKQFSSWSSFLSGFHFIGVGRAHAWMRFAHVTTKALRLGEGFGAVWTNCGVNNGCIL